MSPLNRTGGDVVVVVVVRERFSFTTSPVVTARGPRHVQIPRYRRYTVLKRGGGGVGGDGGRPFRGAREFIMNTRRRPTAGTRGKQTVHG